jgi:hypothetical protein
MRVVAFPNPGAYVVRCAIRPSFRGYVVVAPGAVVTQATPSGQFSFADVPPGTYELKVWFRGQPIMARTVRVGAEDVDLTQVSLAAAPPATAPAAAAASAAPAAREEENEPGRGRGRRRRGGGRAPAGAAAPASAAPAEPPRAPGELRPHKLSGGP